MLCTKMYVNSEVDWLEHCDRNRHGLGLKPTRDILLCFWERHLTLSLLVVLTAVLNFSHIAIKMKKNYIKKFQVDSNILAFPKAGWGNCLANVLAPPSLSCKSE